MGRLLALAWALALLAACAARPGSTTATMGAGADASSTEGAAVAAELGYHGPVKKGDPSRD